MPINWDELESNIDDVIDSAAERTDDRLASKISSITRMTDEEIQELFPKPTDVKKLTRLMKIVKSAEERNNKINKIIDNVEEFGGVVLTILTKFA